MANDSWTSEEIDLAKAELIAAGWVAKTPVLWKSPTGKLHLGPAGAWRVMKRAQNDERLQRNASVADAHPEEPQNVQALIARMTDYLGNGGFFNPELMDHDNVRDLILDARNALVVVRAALPDAGGRVAPIENHEDEASRVAPSVPCVDGQELPQRSERAQSPLPSGRNDV